MSIAPEACAPAAYHVMVKPRGAICNLACEHCYYLAKENLYPGSDFRMSDELLEEFTRQYIDSQGTPEIGFAWQGGEPTLMGLDFFGRAVELQKKYGRTGVTVTNSLQTNGTLLDDEWCRFFARNNFLIGLSMDGPKELHDMYRVDKAGKPTYDRILRGARLLREYGVDYNILTCVQDRNVRHPLEVYRHVRDVIKCPFIQFIPIVKRDNETGFQQGENLTEHTVPSRDFGEFLISIFDEWARRDVGKMYVQIFDVALSAWLGQPPGLCVFEETCGKALVLEHTGDLYTCDHFVQPDCKLGNIQHTPLVELVGSAKQRKFGTDKQNTLPGDCVKCAYRFVCNGGCMRNRVAHTAAGEPGLNHLCAGYKAFFAHIDEPMRFMARELRAGRPAAGIMQQHRVRGNSASRQGVDGGRIGRNSPCPCGSGKKYKQCHGRPT